MECKCGNEKFIIENNRQHCGLYCSECGKWIKWIDKKEIENLRRVKKIINTLEVD